MPRPGRLPSSAPARTRHLSIPSALSILVALTLLALCVPPADAEVRATDDFGTTVRLEAPARRVICLYGALSEAVAALGQEERLIARTVNDELPASLADKPSIGTHMRPNVELVAGLAPDLVLQMAGRSESMQPVEQIRALGIPVAVFAVSDFESLFSMWTRIGTLLGADDAAALLVAQGRARLAAVGTVAAAIPADAPRPRVVFEVRWPNLLVAGQGSIVDDIIGRAGGMNAVEANEKLARFSEEALVALDPDVYLVQRGPMNPNPSPPAARPTFAALRAVREGRVLVVDEERFSRPGPRSLDAVEELAGRLFGLRGDAR